MSKNSEEKEKCQRKLEQMQKFLPFLDYMIDKIKKTNEASLECQLNKFQALRSMITKKNEKYTWDVVIKAEQVIEKLILKLDYKGDVELPKVSPGVKDIKSSELKMSTSMTRAPSSSTNSGDPKLQMVGSNIKNTGSSSIDVIMKSLKTSVDGNKCSKNQNVEKDTGQTLEQKSKTDVAGKILGTNRDKDLDGFNLSRCSNMSTGDSKKFSSSNSISSEKASSQEDLLSSSREKLLKSLQNRLFPNGVEQTSSNFWGNKTGNSSSGEACIKSSDRNTLCEFKYGSLESNDNSESNAPSTKNKNLEKPNPISSKPSKTFGLLEKQRSNEDTFISSLKKSLKEKLSTDICEVYRVPGKSVGGSLRCLKDSKDSRKSTFLEEDALFKPDVLSKVNVPSRGSSSNLQARDAKDKFRQDFKVSELKSNKNNDKTSQNFSGNVKNKQDVRLSKLSEIKNVKSNISIDKKLSNKYEKKDMNKLSDKEEKTEFVKENIRHLPHSAKFKPGEFRKTLDSTFPDVITVSDGELISDDSVQEIDEFLNSTNKSPNELKLMALSPNSRNRNRERYPLASLKILEVGADGAPKNPKPSVTLSGGLKEETEDKIRETTFSPNTETTDEEEDYVIKLIEETTPKNVEVKKKKGLLELPMPNTSDLFDDISSIESFESSNSPKEIRDPRLKKITGAESPESEKKSKKSESGSQLKQSSYHFSNFESKPPDEFPSASLPTGTKTGENQRNDERLLKVSSYSADANRSHEKSKDLKDSYLKGSSSSLNKNSRFHSQHTSAPKSYAEYKRMKRKEQEKLAHCETTAREISQKINEYNISENFYSCSDKNSLNKTSKSRSPKYRNSSSRDIWRGSNKMRQSRDRREPKASNASEVFRNSDENKKRSETDRQKIIDDKRRMSESEELISPLDRLYQSENKPKTGRGYGIQHFKIPKRMEKSVSKSNPVKKANNVKSDSQIHVSSTQTEVEPLKSSLNKGSTTEPVSSEPGEEKMKTVAITLELEAKINGENPLVLQATNETLGSENKEDLNAAVVAEVNQKYESKVGSQTAPESKTVDPHQSEVTCKTDLCCDLDTSEPNKNVRNEAEEQILKKVESDLIDEKPIKKCEPEITECDSSVQISVSNGAVAIEKSNALGEKNTIISKEEITQEYVEALIRKSFESGQGKLLLAQAKLFEELGRKLNSKKLKTIQKIINSESDSSSSSTESFCSSPSSNEKKRKKSKKSKKLKKKRRKHKKLVISSTSNTSSSSSSSESEESDNEKNTKIIASPESDDKVNSDNIAREETEIKTNDFTTKLKSKKKKKLLDYPGCFNRKKNKRKQHQKKLIEEILNEAPVKSEETCSKEPESKPKPKPKTKPKTELDKLHEDIKNMFISSGVITVTGQRMCRILRNAGGKMDNFDIVKESAKMVEEEKLKKAQTSHRSSRSSNPSRQDNRSRSQSLDKSLERSNADEYKQDPKLKSEPYVLLQKVDLNNFGYGVKVSDDCISFFRIQGRNTALRGLKSNYKSPTSEQPLESATKNLSKSIFLERNKRKYQRLNGKVCKTSYKGKKLMDVIKNLPLKMGKMKHLQFCEKKGDDSRKKKVVPEKLDKKMARLGETKQFSDEDLVNHAFQLRKTSYRCKVCSQNFRNITEHYKTVHPEHGVLISRLCQKEATRAKSDAVKNNYEGEQNASKESSKRNTKPVLKSQFCYQCRMCSSSRTNDVNVFFTHVSTHTGEVRFQCPSEDCTVQTANGEEIKFHILTKHAGSRYDLYNKIIELYPSPIEGCQLFGFLCSKCNFVQLSRSNIEAHISKQHPSDKVNFLKINMSSDISNRSKIKRMAIKNGAKNSEQLLQHASNKRRKVDVENEIICPSNANSLASTDVGKLQQDKPVTKENEFKSDVVSISATENFTLNWEKKIEVNDNVRVNEVEDKIPSESTVVNELVTVKDVPDTKENAVDDPLGNSDRVFETLEVGPLKYFLLENSEEYYKCQVQNCGLFTKGFEKFEQHLTFNHHKKKWDGLCQICSLKISNDLTYVLNHLKFHVLKNKPVGSTEELKQNEMELSLQKLVTNSEVSICLKEDISKSQETKKVEKPSLPYPNKPLLKVRNLLGDRLSTPKESAVENEIITITEGEAVQASLMDKMFTIENVRSLYPEIVPGASDINREQVCILEDQHPSGSQVGAGKVILVRSCPTPKIAIRPEQNQISHDVGHFNLVRTPIVTNSVLLNQSPPSTPMHLLSSYGQPVGQYSRTGMNPGIVSGSPTFNGYSNMTPIIRPPPNSANFLPIGTTSETSGTLQKLTPKECLEENCLIKSKQPIEITVSVSPSDIRSPISLTGAKAFSEDLEEKEPNNPLKIFTSIGSKIMKDSSIYKQMLSKTKLCHLFKCMAVECTFTCNDENVFTRHIGLHVAQCRLKKKKGGLPTAKRSRKSYQWQQCAYCCQIISSKDNALAQHVILEHGHCIYQCAYCFYRAISENYVEIHQNLVHGQLLKTCSRTIYKCKPLGNMSCRSSVLEKRGKKQSVRPYICDQCGKNFFVIEEFLNHLTTEHQSVTAYTCHICKNLCFKAKRLVNHYKLHSYCTYQCAYCLHGTETEVEMVFHLCNFHFSQPPVMYLRALPEGVKSQGITQLESLKVIVYESDSLNGESIVEADLEAEEETTYDPLKESVDFSEIVAELGINSGDRSDCEVTPLLKELASFSDQNAKDVTVKTLLPNAQFSSENENINEGCSVLISSGVSIASTPSDEKEMSIPLGQLPLEALNIHQVQPSSSSKNAELPKISDTVKELEISLHAKEPCQPLVGEQEKGKTSEPLCTPCVHNLPQVLVTRALGPKNVYPSRRLTVPKKPSEDSNEGGGKVSRASACDLNEILNSQVEKEVQCSKNKPDNASAHLKQDSSKKDFVSVTNTQPLSKSTVSLSNKGFDNEGSKSISNVKENNDCVSNVKNSPSNVNLTASLKCPVDVAENLETDDSSMSLDDNPALVIDEKPIEDISSKETYSVSKSPDIVILEEEKPDKNIETVTLDSDDEKEPENSKDIRDKCLTSASGVSVGNSEIRKEMEILRHQMANETDSLLLDYSKDKELLPDLTTQTKQHQSFEVSKSKDVLSSVKETISSLNKRLESGTVNTEEKVPEIESKDGEDNSNLCIKPRTRFGSRERKRECAEEKNSEEESKKEDSCKSKKVRKELAGKELYICGNEQCTFAAENISSLKDHLYVCDFSRLSSVLMCPHCSKNFKQFNPYLEHLKYHGEKKFHCGLCSFSSAVESATVRHLKQKHKCHITKTVPRDPPTEEHLVFYPKNHKIDKIDFEENGYSPGDENKLPLQSVYQVNVKCAKCPYFTKVRSNMVRHLKIHMKSAETEGVVVPSTAPTNPVPCLESKEKMFDKMTNLAASSQLAQAEKEKITALPPQVEAKFPQFIAEQLRFKCCLPDCNYITVDDRMLKHHIKALHNEVSHYSCPHCRSTVHVDIRNVPLEKIGHHLKFHDSKLYKCGHCIYIHYLKNLIEKHSHEKHPDRRCFVQTVRDSGVASEEEHSGSEGDATVWKCALCENFQSLSKSKLKDHLLNSHKTKSNYQCQHCPMTGNNLKMIASHFASKHPGEEVKFLPLFYEQKVPCNKLGSLSSTSSADSSNEHFDTTPLWQRGVPRIRHIRGILIEEEEVKTKKSKRWSFEDAEGGASDPVPPSDKVYSCTLCSDRKVFSTKNEDIFRAHLYQELNYYQLACILCGKMCLDKKDFDKHHARMHPDKPPEMNQTKEDREITFWVEQVIEAQREVIKENKRKLNETEPNESSSSPKKMKES